MTVKDEDLKPEVRELRGTIEFFIKDHPHQQARNLLRQAMEALGECPRVSCAYCFFQAKLEKGEQVQPHDTPPTPDQVKNHEPTKAEEKRKIQDRPQA